MDRSHNENGRGKDSKMFQTEASKPKDQWEYQDTMGGSVPEEALQLLRIRGWRRRAANRDEWRRIMR
jgi:hypothetical protein